MHDHKEDYLWKKEAQYYYKSYKNGQIVPAFIFFTVVCLIFNSAMWCIPFIWLAYAFICAMNNAELDRDPEIQKQRAAYEKYIKEKYGYEPEEKKNNN